MESNNKKTGARFVMEKGYYELLEISPKATTLDIQRAFENLCDEHVDILTEDPEKRRRSAETLFSLTRAYEVLTDPFQRHSYDQRKFGDKVPFNNEVETIFKEGLKSFKNNNIDSSIRFLKEAVFLQPHKVNYRVNLAISYAEKGWKDYAEKELRMSLKLEPENQFAQEVVARVLFNVSDKKKVSFFSHKVNRQLAAVAAVSILACGVLVTGIPAMASLLGSGHSNKPSIEEINEMNSQLPADMRKIATKTKTFKNVVIKKLADDFKVQGETFDYSDKVAVKKTYYPAENMVVVEYSDQSVLSYKTHELIGWKNNPETNIPVVITKANEIIPVPVTLPVTLSDGRTVSPADKDFPASVFPEYDVAVKEAQSDNSATNSEVEETNSAVVSQAPEVVKPEFTPANLPPAR